MNKLMIATTIASFSALTGCAPRVAADSPA